jgi:hypothetical protein
MTILVVGLFLLFLGCSVYLVVDLVSDVTSHLLEQAKWKRDAAREAEVARTTYASASAYNVDYSKFGELLAAHRLADAQRLADAAKRVVPLD